MASRVSQWQTAPPGGCLGGRSLEFYNTSRKELSNPISKDWWELEAFGRAGVRGDRDTEWRHPCFVLHHLTERLAYSLGPTLALWLLPASFRGAAVGCARGQSGEARLPWRHPHGEPREVPAVTAKQKRRQIVPVGAMEAG